MFKRNKGIAGITANLDKLVSKLRDHEMTKLAEADKHADVVQKAGSNQAAAVREAMHARTVADKLSDLLSA